MSPVGSRQVRKHILAHVHFLLTQGLPEFLGGWGRTFRKREVALLFYA